MTKIHKTILEAAHNINGHLTQTWRERDLTVFLCGAGADDGYQLRQVLANAIRWTRSKYSYECYFPEDMYHEILNSHHKVDLLGLETQLAESVHSIAILVHSAGAIAELGAFANHPVLGKKLIAISDPKHKNSKSFISLGPIKHLQRQNKDAVQYISLDNLHSNEIAKAIREFTIKISKDKLLLPKVSLTNPIYAKDFCLRLIYVVNPIDVSTLHEVCMLTEESADQNILLSSIDSVISWMSKEGLIRRTSSGLNTTIRAEYLFKYGTASNSSIKLRQVDYSHVMNLRKLFLNKGYRDRSRERAKLPHLGQSFTGTRTVVSPFLN